MTHAELFSFSDKNPTIVWQDNLEGHVLFRNESLPWYQNDHKRSTAITYEKLESMSQDEVIEAVNKSLQVVGMTRVTGYFSKTNQWNKGKLAELKDRRRTDLYGNAPSIGMKELYIIQREIAVA